MKEITLTQGKVALVDDEDFEWLSQWKWVAKRGRSGNGSWFVARSSHGRTILMGREILEASPGQMIDHKNRDPFDNRCHNLRFCTKDQNNQNVSMHRDNKSGYRGVSWRKDRGKWRALIDSKHLGHFDDPAEAARAFDIAAVNQWGEFAGYLNFPERIPFQ